MSISKIHFVSAILDSKMAAAGYIELKRTMVNDAKCKLGTRSNPAL